MTNPNRLVQADTLVNQATLSEVADQRGQQVIEQWQQRLEALRDAAVNAAGNSVVVPRARSRVIAEVQCHKPDTGLDQAMSGSVDGRALQHVVQLDAMMDVQAAALSRCDLDDRPDDLHARRSGEIGARLLLSAGGVSHFARRETGGKAQRKQCEPKAALQPRRMPHVVRSPDLQAICATGA